MAKKKRDSEDFLAKKGKSPSKRPGGGGKKGKKKQIWEGSAGGKTG